MGVDDRIKDLSSVSLVGRESNRDSELFFEKRVVLTIALSSARVVTFPVLDTKTKGWGESYCGGRKQKLTDWLRR